MDTPHIIVKERPIIFNETMVRAIVEGRKTQTRRVMRTTHVGYSRFLQWDGAPYTRAMMSCLNGIKPLDSVFCEDNRLGVPGNLLWVREAWQVTTGREEDDLGACVRYRDGAIRACWMPPEKRLPLGLGWTKWRPSIHMPRWACRLLLEITDVRVERLHSITEEDAHAEGTESREAFEALWRSIYDKPRSRDIVARYGFHGWDMSPWVWVYSFRVLDGRGL